MNVPAGGAYPKVPPDLIALGDTVRHPEGFAIRVTSKDQEPGDRSPYLFGYATRSGQRGTCPFPADQPVTLLHSAGSRAT